MNQVYEKIYKRNDGFLGILKKIGLLILILGIAAGVILLGFQLGNPIIGFAAGVIAIIVIYYGYKLLYMKLDVEFECICLNGEIDIDKIYSKAERKRLITVHAKNFERFGKYEPHTAKKLSEETFATVIKAVSNTDEVPMYAVLNHSKCGRTLIVFEPDERMVEDVYKCAKHLDGNTPYFKRKSTGAEEK